MAVSAGRVFQSIQRCAATAVPPGSFPFKLAYLTCAGGGGCLFPWSQKADRGTEARLARGEGALCAVPAPVTVRPAP